MWKHLYPIINPQKKRNTTYINKLLHDGVFSSDPTIITNVMNNFFCGIGHKIHSEMPDRGNQFQNYLPQRELRTFFLCPTTVEEITLEIKKLNPRKSPGPDGISSKIIQMCPDIFAYNLEKIFNHYIEIGIYPEQLKQAKVIALYKKGIRHDSNNYRPISLLSIINKLFEKIICKQLRAYAEKTKIFYILQFGFMKLSSTTLALIEFTDTIRNLLDNGNYALSFFIDLTKAFDTVDHEILLCKLDRYGIRGHANSFLRSYLSNRSQFTVVNNVQSKPKPIRCGVPQGSVLGPFLFIIYINDLYRSINDKVARLFADDTSLTVHDKKFDRLLIKAKDQFAKFYEWCICNKLKINLSKTCFLLFHNKNKYIPEAFDKIEINNMLIKREQSVKYIGLIVDEKLNWGPHVEALCKSLVRYFGIFKQIRPFVCKSISRQLYYAFIYSRISYAIEVYGTCSKNNMSKIQTIQNGLIKMLLGLDRMTATNYVHKSFNVLKVKDIYTVNVLNIVNNSLLCNCPLSFKDYFIPQTSPYVTRNQGNIQIKRYKTTMGSLAININGAKLWNNLPANIKPYQLRKSFKKHITRHYISNY